MVVRKSVYYICNNVFFVVLLILLYSMMYLRESENCMYFDYMKYYVVFSFIYYVLPMNILFAVQLYFAKFLKKYNTIVNIVFLMNVVVIVVFHTGELVPFIVLLGIVLINNILFFRIKD
jgi:hypothetical protein